jgi:hypothetical protein
MDIAKPQLLARCGGSRFAGPTHFTAIVAPTCVVTPPIVINTGTEFPVVDPAGTTASI